MSEKKNKKNKNVNDFFIIKKEQATEIKSIIESVTISNSVPIYTIEGDGVVTLTPNENMVGFKNVPAYALTNKLASILNLEDDTIISAEDFKILKALAQDADYTNVSQVVNTDAKSIGIAVNDIPLKHLCDLIIFKLT